MTPSMSPVSMMYLARMTAAPEMSSSLLLESVACRHKSQSAERDGKRGIKNKNYYLDDDSLCTRVLEDSISSNFTEDICLHFSFSLMHQFLELYFWTSEPSEFL